MLMVLLTGCWKSGWLDEVTEGGEMGSEEGKVASGGMPGVLVVVGRGGLLLLLNLLLL